jgi:hypothetical protein
VEEDKEKFLERVAWTEQDFSAGSGTTFFFILAPDHTLHPIQEVRSWYLLMPRGSMLGNCKARTWGFTYRAFASRVSPQPRHIALRLACCGPTLQPYSLSPCGRAKFRGKDSERRSTTLELQGRPVRHVDVMQPWHWANLEHTFNLVGSMQVDTMQSDNQRNHRRGKQQARCKHASRSLGTRGELRGGRGDNGGRGVRCDKC